MYELINGHYIEETPQCCKQLLFRKLHTHTLKETLIDMIMHQFFTALLFVISLGIGLIRGFFLSPLSLFLSRIGWS